MASTPSAFASYIRAEQDAIRASVGDVVGLRVLTAAWDPRYLPTFPSAHVLSLSMTPTLGQCGRPALQYAQGLSSGAFDVIITSQLLPHIEKPEARRTYLAELARSLKRNGRLVATTMHYSFRYARNGTPKEGRYDGIFYRRSSVAEFRSELEEFFIVELLHGFWIYLPKTYTVYSALGPLGIYWERMLRRLPLSLRYGKFLLARCRPHC